MKTGFVMQQTSGIEADLVLAVQGLAGGFQSTQHGLLPGSVRVESQHDPPAEFLEQAQLVFSQRSAHR